MKKEKISELVNLQRKWFLTGHTLDVDYRINALKILRNAIIENQDAIHMALIKDLGKSESEGYMCETGLILSEISYMIKHIRGFARKKYHPTPLAHFAATSYTMKAPYGVVLIMSPWNYPFLLSLEPLVDAIAAGNTAIIKPSAYAPESSKVLESIISSTFPSHYVSVVTGGREENAALLDNRFDYIFFTGSKEVGRQVQGAAARFLTPVTLELGGKSPVIITKNANIKLAARRLVFGKFLNCGQTCVAPDYILIDPCVKEAFIKAVIKEINRQIPDPLANDDYGKIINEKHFNRLIGLMDDELIVYGGEYDSISNRIAPTIMDNVSFEDDIMKEEIFGPIMPIIEMDSLGETVSKINSMASPLAFYIFSDNRKEISYCLNRVRFGGGCVNDSIMHLATPQLGFGGFGESGMGSYHGKFGFDTFSHNKNIMDKKNFIDLPMRYRPYNKLNDLLIRIFLR